MTATKTCKTCGETKPVDEFYIADDRGSRRGSCTPCYLANRLRFHKKPKTPRKPNPPRTVAGALLLGDLPNFPHAACKGEPTDLWFPPADLGSSSRLRAGMVAEARRICGECPHQAACADWAIDNPGLSYGGMWGGLDPHELNERRIRKEDAA